MKIINSKKIAILLSTYNGGEYLSQQLDSIIDQTFDDWALYIRDDGSSDSTIGIIKEYQSKNSNIYLLDDSRNLRAKESFFCLLDSVDSEYYMFCDQDDVWFKEKISLCYNYMQLAERKYPNIPLVVHTDTKLVDSELNEIERSFWESANIYPDSMKSYSYLAICSYVLGCTMLFNRMAKESSYPLNRDALMHDWWISTNVIKKGKILSIYVPTMLYRQHGGNVCGVLFGKEKTILFKLKNIIKVISENYRLYKNIAALGYGNIFKYLYFRSKILIKQRFRKYAF